MEISNIFDNTAYLDNLRFNTSNITGSTSFESVLERLTRNQNTQSGTEAVPDTSMRSADIYGAASLMSPQRPAGIISASTPIDKNDELYRLCLELETFIIKNILSGMRKTVMKSGLIEESFAGQMYEDMLWDEYAKVYAQNASFGLAEQAYRSLSGL